MRDDSKKETGKKTGAGRTIKHPKFTVFAAAAAAGILFASGAVVRGISVQHYDPIAEANRCTILVYMVGSDLEGDYGAAREDLLEMEAALKEGGILPEDVRLVVEAGGADAWQYEPMAGRSYARFCLTADGVSGFQEMEPRNMGEADTLADFLNYGTESYPAEDYGLIFWNHGAGPVEGFGSDANFDDDSLTLEELRDALGQTEGREPFSFVIFDACLMGSVELAGVFQGEAEYLVASEGLEPVEGHDYGWLTVFGELSEEGITGEKAEDSLHGETPKDGIDGETVGKAILSSYAAYGDPEDRITLSLMDLGAYELFQQALDAFLSSVSGETGEYAQYALFEALGEKRLTIQGFGSRLDGTAEIVDFKDFLSLWEGKGDPLLYDEVESCFANLLLEQVCRGYVVEPGGLSVYLPSGANDSLREDVTRYEAGGFSGEYQDFVRRYGEYLAQDNGLSWDAPTADDDVLRVEIAPEDIGSIADAYLVAFEETGEDGGLYLLYSDSDCIIDRSGFLEAQPDSQIIGLMGEPLCLIEVMDSENYSQYLAPVLYNGKRCDLYLGFEGDTGTVECVVPENVEKQEYQLKNGDRVIPLYPLEETQETEDGSKDTESVSQDAERIYEDAYYMGDEIVIEDVEAGDALPELVDIDREQFLYGFLIRDTKQKLSYTDLVEWAE